MVEIGLFGAALKGATLPTDNIDHARQRMWAAVLRALHPSLVEACPFVTPLGFTLLTWHAC